MSNAAARSLHPFRHRTIAKAPFVQLPIGRAMRRIDAIHGARSPGFGPRGGAINPFCAAY
jgi:hypothetical protein